MLADLRRALWDEDEAQPKGWARPALWPAALAYRGIIACWSRWGPAARGQTQRLGVPVVSVGNLVIGGSGKTPFAIWLAAELTRRGRRPVLLSRGYGGRAGRGPLVVSDGERICCGPHEAGDETVMIARRMPGLPVVAGADRGRCGAYALERLGADCAILDDGFQHVSLRRDLNILLLDSSRPFGNGRLFPMGPLRELPSALSRADLVVFTRWSERVDGESLRVEIIDGIGEHRVVKTSHRLSGLSSVGDDRELDAVELLGAPVTLVTAIANPRSFEKTVAELGVEVRGHLRFPDHYGFTIGDLSAAALKARAEGARFILTTEKDAVRFPAGARDLDPPAVQVRVSIHVEEGWGVIDHMLESLIASDTS